MMSNPDFFRFKKFTVQHKLSALKVNTDAVLLGALTNTYNHKYLLEIGTGCGVISLMLAQQNEQAQITAIDIDANCVAEALYNFNRSPWKNRLAAVHTSLQNYVAPLKYDCVFSNPPFFKNSLKPENINRAIAKHDNMLTAEIFFNCVARLLTDTGMVSIIVPQTRVNDFVHFAKTNQLNLIRKVEIFSKPNTTPSRAVLQFAFSEHEPVKQQIIIRDTNGNYTPNYKSLLKDYLIIF